MALRSILLLLLVLSLAAAPLAAADGRDKGKGHKKDDHDDKCKPNHDPCPQDECYEACERDDGCGKKVHCPKKKCEDKDCECKENHCVPKPHPTTPAPTCVPEDPCADECHDECDRRNNCGHMVHCEKKKCEDENCECKENHCVPKPHPTTPAPTCHPKNPCDDECHDECDRDDGCGNPVRCQKKTCDDPKKECKNNHCVPKCTDRPCEVMKNGHKFTGTCANKRPGHTICGGDGDCPKECGQCYIPDMKVCGTSNGPCSRAGKCRCFVSKNGAACKADNILGDPDFDPSKLGRGGGCDESMCNAFSRENGGGSMACCPYDCK